MSEAVLIAALSGRALAAAARRAGYAPHVLDLFSDRDTKRLAARSLRVRGSLARGFDDAALLAAAEAFPTMPLVYGAGFEDRPAVLARLAAGRRLLGNRPKTIARLKEPLRFAALAAALGARHPEVRVMPPEDAAGWLVKRAGASGGGHVRPARRGEMPRNGVYFQRRAEGRRVSALFLANRRSARLLGFSLQWPASARRGAFRFGGAAGPVALDRTMERAVADLLSSLAEAVGLAGLNSADLLVREADFALLEINPRPGATLDIFDRTKDGPSLFALHVAACGGSLPAVDAVRAPSESRACAVVYARRRLLVPEGIFWPRWSADRPAAGTRVARGAPLCTVFAGAADAEAARDKAERRAEDLRARLEPPRLAPAPRRPGRRPTASAP